MSDPKVEGMVFDAIVDRVMLRLDSNQVLDAIADRLLARLGTNGAASTAAPTRRGKANGKAKAKSKANGKAKAKSKANGKAKAKSKGFRADGKPRKRRATGLNADQVLAFIRKSGPVRGQDIADKNDMHLSSVQRHLSTLRKAKRVKKVKEGVNVLYMASRGGGQGRKTKKKEAAAS